MPTSEYGTAKFGDMNVAGSASIGSINSIKFPATQVASSNVNALDDYEEGYYTATLTCGTSGTITLYTVFDTLAYTKIGRKVFVQGMIAAETVSSPVGALSLNLPFTTTQLTEEAECFSGSITIYGGTGNVENIAIYIAGASSSILIVEQLGTGVTVANDFCNHIKADTYFYISFDYIVQ